MKNLFEIKRNENLIGSPKIVSVGVDNYQGIIQIKALFADRVEWYLDEKKIKTKYNTAGLFTTELKVKNLIGFVMQDNNMEREFTVKEALLSYAKLYKVKEAKFAVEKMIERFGMRKWQNRRIDRLSGGMARKAMIARALLAEPKLLLLDEPSVGLDPDVRLDIWREIEKLRCQGIGIIITTHYMEEAERLCDRIAILKEGKLMAVDTAVNLKHIMAKDNSEDLTLEKVFLRFIGREAF